MASNQAARQTRYFTLSCSRYYASLLSQQLICRAYYRCHQMRIISSSTRLNRQQAICKSSDNDARPLTASRTTKKFRWYLLPIGLGICLLGFVLTNRNNEKLKKERPYDLMEDESFNYARNTYGSTPGISSGKKEKIRPSGPWSVLRKSPMDLQSWMNSDIHQPGVRPLDPNLNALLSPADGRVLQFGSIVGGEVEQVKGITYSLDALLGVLNTPEQQSKHDNSSSSLPSVSDDSELKSPSIKDDHGVIKQDEEFAIVNGISYTLSNFFSGPKNHPQTKAKDASTIPKAASEAEVRADLDLGEKPWYSKLNSKNQTSLYYAVVYLAPGDYHRFHSPCAWVVQTRRHFVGELYSVSPYLQRTLPGLFTLNERVVLLGRWRWGFFSYIPVGATNVGSIKINFDRELRTNSLTKETKADRAAEEAANRNDTYREFSEASYEAANPTLHGHPLRRGEEMGGFQLGSTIVLVFEAPKGQRPTLDEGWMGEEITRRGRWNWAVKRGQKIKVGEALGWVDES